MKAAKQGDSMAMFSLSMKIALAKLNNEAVPEGLDAKALADEAQEYGFNGEREFLPNLWASAANDAKARELRERVQNSLRQGFERAGINPNAPLSHIDTTTPISPSK
jgi:hypothetical protein